MDLQKDFVEPGGALFVDGSRKIFPVVLELIDRFKRQGLPIITTMDFHEQNDPEFEYWPPHCVKGTKGVELADVVKRELEGYEKHYTIKKRKYSAFYQTKFDALIRELDLDEFHVAGVVTNICVLFTVEELRNRELKVVLYEKGVISYDNDLHRFALRQMKEVLNVEVIE
ncbi:isochorismatase family cysteine hydrolase [Kosmotoga sp.]|uniref:cysteine hydrolase family protein n=1 Tax=Kosmotoga sp. TaxID=1955248 RepID=UPI002590BCF7|nr:isochorismatase family cysteine hydrolase [Kosmotoga sp.]